MSSKLTNWDVNVFASAMETAVYLHADKRFLRKQNNKLLFNGFWRNGDKQNVCIWLDNGTWNDAKTGEKGSCKEFARVAFNMSLIDFIDKFAHLPSPAKKEFTKISIKNSFKDLNILWEELNKQKNSSLDFATSWLINERGILEPQNISSGFLNLSAEHLSFFENDHRKFIQHRIEIGFQMMVPIRGIHSDKVENIFFRSMKCTDKNEKSRLLPDRGGWTSFDNSPRAFGFPHLIKEFPNLVLCEGMADYFAAEFLLDGETNYLPIGVANASAFKVWAEYLLKISYQGQIIFITQLDKINGALSKYAIGQNCVIEACKILAQQSRASNIFNWYKFLTLLNLKSLQEIPEDLAHICAIARKEHITHNAISSAFLQTI